MPDSHPTRDRLLDAAGEIVVGDGLDAATLRAIAARSGVDEVLIGELYPNREQLLGDLLDREFETVRRTALDGIDRDPQGGRLSRILHYSLTAAYEHPLMRALYLLDPDALGTVLRATHGTEFFPRTRFDRRFLEALQDAGLIRPDVDIAALDAALAAFAAGSMLVASQDSIDVTVAGFVQLLERAVDTGLADTDDGKHALLDLLERDRPR